MSEELEVKNEDGAKCGKSGKSVLLCFDDAISMAKGCFDYMGDHDNNELEIYRHGIQTVINVLEAAKKRGLSDLQVATIHNIGSRT